MIVTISKGEQLTIPSALRKALNLAAGRKVEIIQRGKVLVIRPIGDELSKVFERADKFKPRHRLTARQMDELVENELHRH